MKYGVFERAVEDRKFLSMYYDEISKTPKFLSAMKKGIRTRGSKHQEYEVEVFNVFDSFLIEEGYATPSKQKVAGKWGVISVAFDILSTFEEDGFEFRVLDKNKHKGAIKTDKGFFEVSVVTHKKPVTDTVSIASNLLPYIEDLSEKIDSAGFNVILVKNNQVTVATEEGQQTSVKIVKKQKHLF